MTATAWTMLAPLSVLIFLALRQSLAGRAAEKRLRAARTPEPSNPPPAADGSGVQFSLAGNQKTD
jgi:hypothetical protein